MAWRDAVALAPGLRGKPGNAGSNEGGFARVGNDLGMTTHLHNRIMHNALSLIKCDLHAGLHYVRPMTDKADRLKQARERAGYSTAKLAAEAMGVSVASYTQHENGTRGFKDDTAARYAAFFKVPVEWVIFGVRNVDPDSFIPLGPRLYVKGNVAAGVWREAWEMRADEWEVFTGRSDVAAPIKDRFGLRVVGDSMNMIYPPGSILECVAYQGQSVPNGRRVVVQRVRVDGMIETTVKEFMQDESGTIWLVPRSTNPAMQAPIRVGDHDSEIASVEILGVVVSSIRPE